MTLWYPFFIAGAGLIVGQAIIQNSTHRLDMARPVRAPNAHQGTTLMGVRVVMAFLAANPFIFALVGSLLFWMETTSAPAILWVLGSVAGATAIAQGLWVARSMPRIAQHPDWFGKALVAEVMLAVPVTVAMVLVLVQIA